MSTMELPVESQLITKELLTDVLKNGTKSQLVEIDNFNVKCLRRPDENILSVILHISIDAKVDRKDERHHLVSKLVFFEKQRRSDVIKARYFDKETHAYEVLLPAMLSNVNGIQLNVPKCHKGIRENSQNPSVVGIFIEDVTFSGFKPCSSQDLLDFEHCQLSMISVAKFHALSARLLLDGTLNDMPQKELVYLETLYTNTPNHRPFGSFFQFAVKSCYQLFDRIVTDDDLRRKASKHLERNTDDFYSTAVEKPDDLFNVICHGDLKQTNFLFRYDESQHPIDVALIDFQTHRVANPAIDLMYFFFRNTPSELRQQHSKALLKVYHETFLECLTEMNLSSDIFTFDDLRNSVKKYALFGCFTGLYMVIMFSPYTRGFVNFYKDFTQEDVESCIEAMLKGGEDVKLRVVGIISDIIAINEDNLF